MQKGRVTHVMEDKVLQAILAPLSEDVVMALIEPVTTYYLRTRLCDTLRAVLDAKQEKESQMVKATITRVSKCDIYSGHKHVYFTVEGGDGEDWLCSEDWFCIPENENVNVAESIAKQVAFHYRVPKERVTVDLGVLNRLTAPVITLGGENYLLDSDGALVPEGNTEYLIYQALTEVIEAKNAVIERLRDEIADKERTIQRVKDVLLKG